MPDDEKREQSSELEDVLRETRTIVAMARRQLASLKVTRAALRGEVAQAWDRVRAARQRLAALDKRTGLSWRDDDRVS